MNRRPATFHPEVSCIQFSRSIAGKIVLLSLSVSISFSARSQQPLPAAYTGNSKVNYVRVWNALKPVAHVDSLTVATPAQNARMTTSYFDGLGRGIQQVVKQGSLATGNPSADLVNAIIYDEFGREQFSYLPFAASSHGGNNHINDGLFKLNPFQQDSAFNKSMFGDENWFHGQTVFEPSPLNRATKTMAAGNSWVGAGRGIEMKYWINTVADSVYKWGVSDVAGTFGDYDSSGLYPSGQLYKNVVVDEHGKQVVEFKDKDGLVILKKLQLTAPADTGTGKGYAGWLCTYYIYDDLNQLRCMIQPEGVKQLATNNWQFNATILNEQCFQYAYDGRGRMTRKKVPGAGSVRMVYDTRDRLVLLQDSMMQAAHQWLYTRYDGLNRPIATGLFTDHTHYDSLSYHAARADTSSSYPAAGVYTIDTLTQTFYDDYTWRAGQYNPLSATRSATYDGYLQTASNASWPYPQDATAQSNRTKAMITGTKVKLLGTSSGYLYSVSFYDDKGRVIQVQSTNITGGTDIVTTQYSWNGQPLLSVYKQEKAGSPAQTLVTLTKIVYDSLWRIAQVEKKISHNQVDGGDMPSAWTTILQNEYDALGQLKKKQLAPDYAGGSGLDSLVYDYNIRGWMLGMNRDYIRDAAEHYFGFELGYDKTDHIITGASYAHAQYNGNIGGMSWKSKGDSEKRKYDFIYDAGNRIVSADFNQYTSGSFNKDAGVDFSMSSLSYDANGNIRSMKHRGVKTGGSYTIDSLTYNYITGSNKLLNVIDGVNDPDTKLGDFRTSALHPSSGSKNSSTTDYFYDGNGNMVKDLNKDIISYSGADGIEYNFLNLTERITIKKDGSTNKGYIEYTYDATGNKLKKTTYEPGVDTTVTFYLGGAVFKNDTLEFIGHEEGRVRFVKAGSSVCTPQDNRLVYDYFIKDHLGNVRMVLTEQQDDICYIAATVEDDAYDTETTIYDIADGRRIDKSTTDASAISGFDDRIYRVHGGLSGEKTGLGAVLKVMAGDEVRIVAESYYTMPGGGPGSPLTLGLTELLTAFAGSGAIVMGHGSVSASTVSNTGDNNTTLGNFIGNTTAPANTAEAFVNWILFDEQLKYVTGGADPVNTDGGYKLHEAFINNPVAVTKNGYLYIYVSNESNFPVYFDNLAITHTPGPVMEENAYYPFGLAMRGISSKAMAFSGAENRYKYNGVEEQRQEFSDDSGLEWLDYGARMYDAQIGRWTVQDPKSWKYAPLSPYNFANNMPLNAIDIKGEDIYIITDNKAVKVAIETLKKTDAGRALLEKYENSKTHDVYISAQEFMIKDKKGNVTSDGYTMADIGSVNAIGEDGKLKLRGNKDIDQRTVIEFSEFEGLDVSKSEGKSVFLVTLATQTFDEKSKNSEDKSYNAMVLFDEIGAHVDKYDGKKSDAEKEHEAIGVRYTSDGKGGWIETIIKGSELEKLMQQLQAALDDEKRKKEAKK